MYLRDEEWKLKHKKALSRPHWVARKKSETWKQNRLGDKNPSYRGGIREHIYTCSYCKKEFIKEGHFARTEYKFCSLSCSSKGVKRTNEWYENLSNSLKKRYRKEGLKESKYRKFTRKLKEEIRKRDDFKCQECGVPELELGRKLDVHHIDYNKKNYLSSNLICLCNSCHTKTNFNRKQWSKYYSKLVKE